MHILEIRRKLSFLWGNANISYYVYNVTYWILRKSYFSQNNSSVWRFKKESKLLSARKEPSCLYSLDLDTSSEMQNLIWIPCSNAH